MSLSKTKVRSILRQASGLSGTPRIFFTTANFLSQKNFDVSLVVETPPPMVKLKCYRTFKWPRSSLFQRRFFNLQAELLNRRSPVDIVIGHGDTLKQDVLFLHTCVHKQAEVDPSAARVKKNASIPFHREIFEKGSFKVLICNSLMMKEDVQKRFGTKVPTYVIYPGHDPRLADLVDPQMVKAIRESLSRKNGTIVIGLVTSGNLGNRGARALIEAAGLLPSPLKETVSVLVVGKEKHPEQYETLAREKGLVMKWMDPRPDVQNLIASVDVVVHAAKMEAFGMSVLEAMALGKPIISTRYVGATELFNEEQKKFIVDDQNPTEIADRLKTLVLDENLRRRLGSDNARISSAYTWDRYNQKVFDILESHFKLEL